MTQVHLTLKPKASQVFDDPARFVMATCGRRFGKSYLSCAKALHVALSKPRSNTLMLAPTFEMGRATLWRTLKDMVPDSWLVKTSESLLEMQFVNGSRVEVNSGDRPDRLRGRRKLKVHPRCKDVIRDLQFMVFEEGTDQPDKSDPERSHNSDALGYCVLGAMKPLMPKKHQVRGSTLRVW